MELTVAITGASGAIYAHRTLIHLAASGVVERINLIVSDSAKTVAMVELGFDLRSADEQKLNEWIGLPAEAKIIRWHRLDNMAATPSSGSHPQAGMLIVPCSMGTLGAIASGAGTNLIHRANSSGKSFEAGPSRRADSAGKPGLLSSATNDRGPGGSSSVSHSRSVRDSAFDGHAMER